MLHYLQKNIDITNMSNFKTKATTKYFFEVNTENDINKFEEIYNFASNEKLEVLIIGAGTNMLFAFENFSGIIIKNNLNGWNYNNYSKILTTYSNENVWDIAIGLENNFNNDLWHRFIGLPGSIGGGVYGNAGCFGLEMENNFIDIIVYNILTNKIETLSKNDMKFSYRDSILKQKKHYFIISIRFDLSKKIEKYSSDVDNIKFREEIQPKGNSCGSFFKNPSREKSAGFLIEQVGLKGYKYGCAYFSEKHANFLMTNKNNGNYKDLIYLIDLAQNKIKKEFGVELINEVNIITN